jgi:cell division septation protein DedD
MERIRSALTAARREREKLLAQDAAGGAENHDEFGVRNSVVFGLIRDEKVWFGLACFAVAVAMLAWMIGSKNQSRTTDMRVATTAQVRADISAADALSGKLALLQAHVDLLADSITRIDDKVAVLLLQINAVSSSVDSSTEGVASHDAPAPAPDTASDVATLEVLSKEQQSMVSTDAASEPTPTWNRRRDEAVTRDSSAVHQTLVTVEDESASMGVPNAPNDKRTSEVSSAADKFVAPAAVFRTPEALHSLRHSKATTVRGRENKEVPDSNRAPEEASTEIAFAEPKSAAAERNGLWVVNLASFADRQDAAGFSERAQSKEVDVEQNHVTVKGKSYWRVRVTGFRSAAEAKGYAASVEAKLGLKETWISRR